MKLVCFVLSILCYHFVVDSSPVWHLTLIPADDYDDVDNQTGLAARCSEVECPELKCQKVIQKEEECCKSCDTSG